MDIITVCIGILSIFLIGYISGKKVGYKKGLTEGIHFAPLKMRVDMISSGKCPICSQFLRMEDAN